MDLDTTIERIKTLIVRSLNLHDVRADEIDADAPLFLQSVEGHGLGLDSVDALELVVALEKEFGIRTESHEIGKEAFASVRALARFVHARVAARPDAQAEAS